MTDYENIEGMEYLDLILTDPPYIISRESGMNSHYNKVKENKKEFMKTAPPEDYNETRIVIIKVIPSFHTHIHALKT